MRNGICRLILNHENYPSLPQLPPIFVPSPTIRESFAGPLGAMGALVILVGIAMAATYLSVRDIVQERYSRSFGSVHQTGWSYSSGIAPQLNAAEEKYNH